VGVVMGRTNEKKVGNTDFCAWQIIGNFVSNFTNSTINPTIIRKNKRENIQIFEIKGKIRFSKWQTKI